MCPKRKFPSRALAEWALEEIRARRRQLWHRQECACYQCPKCGAWHLTSQGNPWKS